MKMKMLSQKKCKKRKEREEAVASCKTSKRLFPIDDEPEMKLKMLLLSLKDHLLSEYGYPWTMINGYDTQPLQDVVETALTSFASPSEKNEEAVVASCKTSKPLQMDKSVEKEMKCEKRKERKVESKKKKRKERVEVVSSSKTSKTSKPLPMDKSGEKEMKLVKSVRGGFAVPGCGEVGRIIVSGYDIGLPRKVVETALRNHFSNCGVITDVFVPKSYYRRTTADAKKLDPDSYIYFVGEGAVDKALLLNGTDVGGWTVNIEPYPFEPDAKHTIWLTAEGFDTSVSTIDIKRELIRHFSSCGRVYDVFVVNGLADLRVTGEDAEEKVPKLNGSSFMGHHKLVLRDVCYADIQTVHIRPLGPYRGRN